MTYFLIFCLAVHAVILHRRLAVLREDLRHVNRSSRVRLEDMDKVVREARSEAQSLRAELNRRGAEKQQGPARPSWFTPYMTIQDALNLHPGVKGVLASLHIGGCSSCSVSARETLEQAAAGHGVDLAEMLEKMNALMDDQPPADLRDMLAVHQESAEEVEARRLREAEKALPPAKGGRVMLGMAAAAPPTGE